MALNTIAQSAKPRLVPASVDTLNVWRYMEYSVLRILAGWGRQAGDWEDKLAVCYHVWLQAEIVDRLRRRLEMFPPHRPETPCAQNYELLGNAVLLAPGFGAAIHGLHGLLNPALTSAYESYLASSHPVHDKPTHDLLSGILAMKAIQEAWFEDFQRRHPVTPSFGYDEAVRQGLEDVNFFKSALSLSGPAAQAVGSSAEFRMPQTPGRLPHWNEAPNIFPLLEVDWSASVETRRLYFMIGYFWEMGVAESQLRWLFYADFMPWEFIYEEARHMWDESRHGNSGLSRLRDFGLDIRDVGYSSYNAHGDGTLPPMTPRDVYEAFYQVTQIAERGFFKTKTYSFEDFASGGDAASAEMMQYDIIDETSHAEYGRKWLSEMAARAGAEEDWLQRGGQDREAAQKASDERVAAYRRYQSEGSIDAPLVMEGGQPNVVPTGDHRVLLDPAARNHYQRLLQTLRAHCPLTNALTAPGRPNLPM
jgi:hypothetical protein